MSIDQSEKTDDDVCGNSCQAALLIVLPISKSAYDTRIATSDYLSRYSLNPEAAWLQTYEPEIARFLCSLKVTAQSAGAIVYEDATIRNLKDVTTKYQIVVLLSHWKERIIGREDIIGRSPEEYIAVATRATTEPAKWLEKEFCKRRPQDMNSILKVLENFIESKDAWNGQFSNGFEVLANPFTIQSWNRDQLDRLFCGLIEPGNRIEFSDGLYSKEEVAAHIDSQFHGVLDLTTCTSTVLSDHLALISRGSYATVQFDEPQNPEVTCLFLERTFQLLGEGITYLDARNQALKDFVNLLNEMEPEKSKNKKGWIARLTKKVRKSR